MKATTCLMMASPSVEGHHLTILPTLRGDAGQGRWDVFGVSAHHPKAAVLCLLSLRPPLTPSRHDGRCPERAQIAYIRADGQLGVNNGFTAQQGARRSRHTRPKRSTKYGIRVATLRIGAGFNPGRHSCYHFSEQGSRSGKSQLKALRLAISGSSRRRSRHRPCRRPRWSGRGTRGSRPHRRSWHP